MLGGSRQDRTTICMCRSLASSHCLAFFFFFSFCWPCRCADHPIASSPHRLSYAITLLTNPSDELIPPVLQLINAVSFAALDHELSYTQAASFLCKLSRQRDPSSSDVVSLIVDMFWVTEIQYETCAPEKLEDLCALAKAIIVCEQPPTTPHLPLNNITSLPSGPSKDLIHTHTLCGNANWTIIRRKDSSPRH